MGFLSVVLREVDNNRNLTAFKMYIMQLMRVCADRIGMGWIDSSHNSFLTRVLKHLRIKTNANV